jgi:hypothetical protein
MNVRAGLYTVSQVARACSTLLEAPFSCTVYVCVADVCLSIGFFLLLVLLGDPLILLFK